MGIASGMMSGGGGMGGLQKMIGGGGKGPNMDMLKKLGIGGGETAASSGGPLLAGGPQGIPGAAPVDPAASPKLADVASQRSAMMGAPAAPYDPGKAEVKNSGSENAAMSMMGPYGEIAKQASLAAKEGDQTIFDNYQHQMQGIRNALEMGNSIKPLGGFK